MPKLRLSLDRNMLSLKLMNWAVTFSNTFPRLIKTLLWIFFLLEHNGPVNVDAMNTEYISRSQEVWDSIEADRWLYNLDNDEGILPDFKSTKNKSNKL